MILNGFDRLTLIQFVLPEKVGSLEESFIVKEIRDNLEFTDEEKEEVGADANDSGIISMDPRKIGELDEIEYNFSAKEREVIGYGFALNEQDNNVKTDDTYLRLAEEFEEEIRDAKQG